MRYASYYRKMLSKEEKAVYDLICSGVINYQTQISTPHFEYSKLNKIIFSIKYDNPEFFHVDYTNVSMRISSIQCEIIISYFMSRQQYSDIMKKVRNKTIDIFSKIKNQSQLNQSISIHDWLVKNVTYSTKNYYPNSSYTMIGAILSGECVCEGYSMAYKYLMDVAHVHCSIVCGEGIHPDGTKGKHAWNLLILGHKPYHVDVTFDQLFAGQYCSRAHFLLSTKEILYNHQIDSIVPIPICPENGGILKCVTRTSELIQFLEIESKRNVSYSEVRLSAKFTKNQLFQMIDEWLATHKSIRLLRNPQYWFGDYNRTLFIIWK